MKRRLEREKGKKENKIRMRIKLEGKQDWR